MLLWSEDDTERKRVSKQPFTWEKVVSDQSVILKPFRVFFLFVFFKNVIVREITFAFSLFVSFITGSMNAQVKNGLAGGSACVYMLSIWVLCLVKKTA